MSFPESALFKSHPAPRVVVIEDDSAIQNLIGDSMPEVGDNIKMLRFKDAQMAIHELWEQEMDPLDPVDIIFLDIMLEGESSGLDVLDYTQYLPAPVPIVLMSSDFSEAQIKHMSTLTKKPILLRKPFGRENVIQISRWIFSRQLGLLA